MTISCTTILVKCSIHHIFYVCIFECFYHLVSLTLFAKSYFALLHLQEAHVALAFKGASWTSEYSYPLMVMQTLLGSWDRASAGGRNVSSKCVVV